MFERYTLITVVYNAAYPLDAVRRATVQSPPLSTAKRVVAERVEGKIRWQDPDA